MSANTRSRIRREVELIDRFANSYGRKFADLMGRLNTHSAAADGQCLRLCVEAVNMILNMQGQLARVLDDLSRESAPAASSRIVPRLRAAA